MNSVMRKLLGYVMELLVIVVSQDVLRVRVK